MAARRRMLFCSFCGDNEYRVDALITGAGTAICAACARAGLAALDSVRARPATIDGTTPTRLVADLDRHVVGQESAKRALSVAVYNHFKRVGQEPGRVRLTKSNILLIGASGTGKTLLAETLARSLAVPFVVADVTSITQAGYAGEDLESIFRRLLIAADGDVEAAQRGIVFLDEMDKLARRETGTLDVSGEGVQQGLLKILEGTSVALDGRPGDPTPATGQPRRFDTRNVLFIGGGAFVGLDDIVSSRERRRDFGFTGGQAGRAGALRPTAGAPAVEPTDLTEFGLLPELVGRFPIAVRLHALGLAELRRILVEPENSLIAQYEELFRLDGHALVWTVDALAAVAGRADAQGTGARGLRSVLEAVLGDLMYHGPDLEPGQHLSITADYVEAVLAGTASPTGTAGAQVHREPASPQAPSSAETEGVTGHTGRPAERPRVAHGTLARRPV